MPRLSKIGAAALAAFGWTSGGVSAVTASVLIVGGGGGAGGNTNAANGGRTTGGGGGGGVLTGSSATLNPTLSYTVVVGAGGSGGIAGGGTAGTNGSNSTFLSVIANGGGGGGAAAVNALSGGSGGGGGNYLSNPGTSNQSSYSGYTAYGNSGGTGTDSAPNYGSGGGGGAGGAGANSTANVGGNGGAGISSSISGSSLFYAGGGGGAAYGSGSTNQGTGGSGVGGDARGDANGLNGAESRGGGGGGCGHLNASTNASYAGGNGGSGVVIISYPGAQQFGGGVVTSVGGNTIHTFTTSGTLSPLSSLTASYLIVAGGGGGGAGGGGAGGMVTGSGSTLDTNSIYLITVGAGGSGPSNTSGSNSSISIVSTTAIGGGFGDTSGTAGNGGSGGGGASPRAGGTGTAGQGNNGGSAVGTSSPFPMAGGGGAGAVGGNATGSTSGNGGNGLASSISGSSVTYAGGGGGASTSQGATAGTGGTGGGGNGATASVAAQNGGTNLGGGGGGYANQGGSAPGNGGSGIVIISYPGSTPQMAGGTVTAAGGNIIHTFTSSGYLTPITNLNNSLRFRSSASAYLSRTPTVTGNRRTWTWSAWVKRGSLGVYQPLFTASETLGSNNNANEISFTSSNTLNVFGFASITGTIMDVNTTQVFRDPSAWYHIVVAIDTTQATASNRVKVYVNGSQITAFGTATYPSQNYDLWTNVNNMGNYLGRWGGAGSPGTLDGYMAEVNHIDGQALTPSSFGAFNGQGVWQPVRYGGSYGTNGFYLPFNQGSSTFAGSFNGSNQYLSVADNAAFDYGSGEFTIEGWIYSTSAASSSGTGLFSKRANNGIFAPIQVLYFNSQLILYASTSGSSWAISATQSGSLSLNTWYHFAVVRIGNTITLYVNGTSVASGTVSGALMTNSSALTIAAEAASGTGLFAGQISNFRIVKGAAIYNSNFVPPVSPLTNVSGTSLLTLQSATVTDNSSNAFAITNNGSVTLAANTIVFANPKSLCLDQSPAQNNWTPNNISNTVGSTYDSMTDVPTNTSATVANYCVLNVLGASQPVTVSNANLTVSCGNGSTYGNIIGSMAIPSSGKYYFEAVCTSNAAQATWGLQSNPGSGTNRFEWYSGTIYYNGTSTSGATYATNDVLALAIDVDGGTIYTYKNGTLQNTVSYNISALTLFPYFGTGFANTIVAYNANFGQQPFRYTPPAGFVALNTFNLPTPTIGATPATTANKYFDATLYTGTGSAMTVTNAGGFKPDLFWIKSRSLSGSNHVQVDSVRGVTKCINSSLTNAESTSSAGTGLTAINSNGFSLGTENTAAGSMNDPSGTATYVAWQWQAGQGTTSSNTQGSITSTVSVNTTAGFSIVTYTGNSSAAATVGHGLGVKPDFIIIKNRDEVISWMAWHSALSTQLGYLNLTDAFDGSRYSWAFSSTQPTSTLITLGDATANGAATNKNGIKYVAYCFAQVAGYSAFGSYTGNGSTDGPFIYTGFRPRFILVKRAVTNSSPDQSNDYSSWVMYDTVRNTYNNQTPNDLYSNKSSAEGVRGNGSATSGLTDMIIGAVSNGFYLSGPGTETNANTALYIYAAFAESPFKYANAR